MASMRRYRNWNARHGEAVTAFEPLSPVQSLFGQAWNVNSGSGTGRPTFQPPYSVYCD